VRHTAHFVRVRKNCGDAPTKSEMKVSITAGTNQKRIHFGNWKGQNPDYSIIKVIKNRN